MHQLKFGTAPGAPLLCSSDYKVFICLSGPGGKALPFARTPQPPITVVTFSQHFWGGACPVM